MLKKLQDIDWSPAEDDVTIVINTCYYIVRKEFKNSFPYKRKNFIKRPFFYDALSVPVFHEISVFKATSHVKRTSSGSDKLPFSFWKDHALERTPMITP